MQGTMQNTGDVYAGKIHLLSSQASLGFFIYYKTTLFLSNVPNRLLVWLIHWVHLKNSFTYSLTLECFFYFSYYEQLFLGVVM